MVKEVKWTKYLWLSLLSFGAFMLELLSIFAIEVIILHVDIQNYTMQQRSIHCIIMVFMWAFFIGVLLLFSRKHYHFPERGSKRDKISSKSWIVTLACFIGCKIMTFIDWHTLKIVGEAQGKTVFQFCAQYLYYIFEVLLVILIIIYGQKAIETLLKKESPIPFGGIILAMTWGAIHFVSRGVGPIVTTGNELVKQQIADFSKQLNLEELYSYIFEVRESTEKMLGRFSYDELKRKIPDGRKGYLESLNVVNGDEKAIWLIDYWCSKDIRGLIQMPFSRHWIMHTEACLRIKNKIHS